MRISSNKTTINEDYIMEGREDSRTNSMRITIHEEYDTNDEDDQPSGVDQLKRTGLKITPK